MKKLSKVMIATALIASMFTITAYAKDIGFSATRTSALVKSNTKDRTQNTWLITNTNMNNSQYFQTGDVIDFRIRSNPYKTSTNAMSDVMMVSSFVTNYAYPYTVIPTSHQTVYLFAQVDSSSARNSFKYSGKWFT